MKLTPNLLRKIIIEEKSKLASTKKAKEVDADQLANTLEKHVDHLALLKIKEVSIKRKLAKIQEARKKTAKRIKRLA